VTSGATCTSDTPALLTGGWGMRGKWGEAEGEAIRRPERFLCTAPCAGSCHGGGNAKHCPSQKFQLPS